MGRDGRHGIRGAGCPHPLGSLRPERYSAACAMTCARETGFRRRLPSRYPDPPTGETGAGRSVPAVSRSLYAYDPMDLDSHVEGIDEENSLLEARESILCRRLRKRADPRLSIPAEARNSALSDDTLWASWHGDPSSVAATRGRAFV